jgi:hypothetical protein
VQPIHCYSLSSYLFFSWYLILPVLPWLCLFLSSVCRIPFRIFFSGDLLLIYCFSFCLLWKTFIPPSILNDCFPRAESVFFQCSKYLTPYPSCFWGFSWEVYCYLDGFTFICYLFFLSYSLQYSFCVLCACFSDNMSWRVLFWSSLFGVLEASCTWMDNSFPRFGKLSDIILNILHICLLAPLLLLRYPWF